MSSGLWDRVRALLDEHSYMDGVERTIDRVKASAEVFTPSALVVEILQYTDVSIFAPGRTVLDPACGDGQFLVAAKWIKILHHGMDPEDALHDIYGVDIMRDNVDICRRRLGGGTILMGDTLHPAEPLPGQTDLEHQLMMQIFGVSDIAARRKSRRSSRASTSSSPERPSLFD